MLSDNAGDFTWTAAAVGSRNAAAYQLATEFPVMAVGGQLRRSGTDVDAIQGVRRRRRNPRPGPEVRTSHDVDCGRRARINAGRINARVVRPKRADRARWHSTAKGTSSHCRHSATYLRSRPMI
ncbi:hypothetical protein [Nocardia donostiensis]